MRANSVLARMAGSYGQLLPGLVHHVLDCGVNLAV